MATPPSGHCKKSHIAFPDQPSTSLKIPCKSHSNSIRKTLVVLVLLLAISFFPSQPPDFISRTISPRFWEVLHLLFVAIAVSYGLFCRKPALKIETSRIDDGSRSFLSGVSHLSTIFDDGFVNTRHGADEQEQDSMQSSCSCQCFQDPGLGQSWCVVHGGSISTKFGRQGFDKNVRKNRTLSSKYSRDESLVAVGNGESLDLKHLNLPVSSLGSNVADRVQSEPIERTVAKGKGNIEVRKIRGVVPINLEKRFEEESDDINPRIHCMPHSVGEFKFGQNKSRLSNKLLKLSTPGVEKNVAEESEKGRRSELKEAKINIEYDLGSEVDRKAGEFIAKFREQIRRQKASSS